MTAPTTRTAAQSVCDVVNAWEIQGRMMIRIEDVQTLIEPLRAVARCEMPTDAALRARFDEESV